eukprot:GHRQ01036584.1.p2 GENE.GHRQ01036584.1~~GHRQ01036584.1.p2  ORF type:complete len:125 (+),score=20.56 GHRQ01036584.1:54-377(+)
MLFVTSMPGLRKWLGHERVAILTADCEGCEYSIARDVLQEDPGFFNHIDQFAVQVHYSRCVPGSNLPWAECTPGLTNTVQLNTVQLNSSLYIMPSCTLECHGGMWTS